MFFEPIYEYRDPELRLLVNYDTLPKVVNALAALDMTFCSGGYARTIAQAISWVYGIDAPWIYHLERVLSGTDTAPLKDPEYVKTWIDWYVGVVREAENRLVAETGQKCSLDYATYTGTWTYVPLGGGPSVKIYRRSPDAEVRK
ncbi:MAG: hypothetical protein H0X04_00250 [Chthoniobacterales bacterium]|nr:hypothetical protein [Chthoniobacterales bacterium]